MLLVDNDQQEMILFGKGMGYATKPGTLIDTTQIEQIFIPLSEMRSQHFLALTDTIPAAFFDVTHDIMTQAQHAYGQRLKSVLLFTLAEHLHFAVEQARKGQCCANKLSWEIKRYYPKEYHIGVSASAQVSTRFRVELGEDEAVNIAFHFINASGESEQATAHQQVMLVNRIAEIVRYKLNQNLDTESVHYMRFITHLRYVAERVLTTTTLSDDNDGFYQEFLKMRPDAMKVAWAIKEYILEKYAINLPNDEVTYLTMHICRLKQNL